MKVRRGIKRLRRGQKVLHQLSQVSVNPGNVGPSANISTDVQSGTLPLAVEFDGSASFDTDGTIISYAWDFGDGSTGSGSILSHTYTSAGTFTAKLTVTDDKGAVGVATVQIQVSAGSNQVPIASYFASAVSGEKPLTVNLNASGSSDPDGSIVSYAWNFGDGQTGTGQTTSHVFANAGNYTLRLTVTDNEGATAFVTKQITVTNPVVIGSNVLVQSIDVYIDKFVGAQDATLFYFYDHISKIKENSDLSSFQIRRYSSEAAANADADFSSGTLVGTYSGAQNHEKLIPWHSIPIPDFPGEYFRVKVTATALNGDSGEGISSVFGPIEAKPAADYYISASGSNANPGTQAQPFRDAGALPTSGSGRVVAFERGGVYNGGINPVNGSQYIAYGSAEKRPIIKRTTVLSGGWSQNGNIWSRSYAEVRGLYLNGEAHQRGQFPKYPSEMEYMDTVSGNTSFTRSTIPDSWGDNHINGAEFIARVSFFQTEDKIVNGYTASQKRLNINAVATGNLFPASHGIATRWMVQNHENLCEADGEWAYRNGVLYVYFEGDLNAQTVEVIDSDHTINATQKNNLTFQGLEIWGSRRTSIELESGYNFTFRGCDLSYHAKVDQIGAQNADTIKVISCSFREGGNGGIYAVNFIKQGQDGFNSNILIDGCVFGSFKRVGDNTHYVFAYGAITNMYNRDMIVRNCGGYDLGRDLVNLRMNALDGTLIENCWAARPLQVVKDGAGFYCWNGNPAQSDYYQNNGSPSVWRKNFCSYSGHHGLSGNDVPNQNSYSGFAVEYGFYCDDGAAKVELIDNFDRFPVSGGILLHNASDCKVNGQRSFGGQEPIGIIDDDIASASLKIFGTEFENNRAVTLRNGLTVGTVKSVGSANPIPQYFTKLQNNRYYMPSGNNNGITAGGQGYPPPGNPTLADWEVDAGRQDIGSSYEKIAPPSGNLESHIIQLENPRSKQVTPFLPSGTWNDEAGNAYTGVAPVAPHSALQLTRDTIAGQLSYSGDWGTGGGSGPQASFFVSPSNSGTEPFTVSVTSTSSGDNLSHEWDWGDGSAKSSGWEGVQHTYQTDGEYLLKLKVTQGTDSQTAESTQLITVLNSEVQDPNEVKILMLYGDVSDSGAIPSGASAPFHQMRLNDGGSLGFSGFKSAIDAMTEGGKSFVITEMYDQVFDLSTISDYDIIFLGSSQRNFSSGEIDTIENYVKNGGGLVAFSDSALGGNYSQVGAQNQVGQNARNPLMRRFGMEFYVDQSDGVKTLTIADTEAISGGSAKTFRGEGVSPIRLNSNAGTNEGNPRSVLAYTNSIGHQQGVTYQGDICAIAEAEPGAGWVIAIFDRNMFWNGGPGTDISEVDNQVVLENIFKRAAGLLETPNSGGGGETLIAETNWPASASMANKDAWRNFWDTNGLGRYNSSGGQFTSSPITATNGILKIPYQTGDWGGSGWQNTGAIIYQSLPRITGKKFGWEFDVKFSDGFDWGTDGEQYRGGKFGMSVTVGNVGVGSNPGLGNFSMTTMWRDGGKLDNYLYHAGQASNWPDKIIYHTIQDDTWYNFKVEIKNNDPGQTNGHIKIWVDGVLRYNKTDFQFTNGGDVLFQPAFGCFFGGDSNAWQARNNCDIQFGNIKIYG